MSLTTLLRTAALGAAAMYFMDPDRGRRRRAVAQDKARSSMRRGTHFIDAARRDARNRLHGLKYRVARLDTEQWPPAVRLAAIAGGGSIAVYGLACSGVSRLALSATGLALVTRGATNTPLRELIDRAREASQRSPGNAASSRDADLDRTGDWTPVAPSGFAAEHPGA